MRKTYKIGGVFATIFTVLLVATAYLKHQNIQVLNPAGPIAARERHLLIIATLLMLVVVVPVFALTFLIAWRYRESNTKAKYSPDLDGNRAAETIWWLIPSALIAVLAIITWNSTHQLDPYRPLASTTKPLTIQVVALNWKWLFIYPQQHIATVNYLEFPKNTPVNFVITSDATMNSFWIPQLGGQIYAMTGMTTQLHLEASKVGDFRGSSANISGRGFAGMEFMAHATSQDEFNNWLNVVRSSPQTLTADSYAALTKPTVNNSPAYFASSQPNLFADVIYKYSPMSTASSMPGMNMSGDSL